jgi:hypothetical protein
MKKMKMSCIVLAIPVLLLTLLGCPPAYDGPTYTINGSVLNAEGSSASLVKIMRGSTPVDDATVTVNGNPLPSIEGGTYTSMGLKFPPVMVSTSSSPSDR